MRYMIAWVLVGGAALSLGSAAAEVAPPGSQVAATQTAQYSAQPAYPFQRPVYVPPASNPWESYKARLAALARQKGVREATIQTVIPSLDLNQRVMDLDRAQTPTTVRPDYTPSFGPYLERHITTSLINRGYARYATHWPRLSRIESL